MNQIVVTFGKTEKTRGMSFVALSRVRRLEDILINDTYFDSSRLLSVKLPKYIIDYDIKTMKLVKNTRNSLKTNGKNIA